MRKYTEIQKIAATLLNRARRALMEKRAYYRVTKALKLEKTACIHTHARTPRTARDWRKFYKHAAIKPPRILEARVYPTIDNVSAAIQEMLDNRGTDKVPGYAVNKARKILAGTARGSKNSSNADPVVAVMDLPTKIMQDIWGSSTYASSEAELLNQYKSVIPDYRMEPGDHLLTLDTNTIQHMIEHGHINTVQDYKRSVAAIKKGIAAARARYAIITQPKDELLERITKDPKYLKNTYGIDAKNPLSFLPFVDTMENIVVRDNASLGGTIVGLRGMDRPEIILGYDKYGKAVIDPTMSTGPGVSTMFHSDDIGNITKRFRSLKDSGRNLYYQGTQQNVMQYLISKGDPTILRLLEFARHGMPENNVTKFKSFDPAYHAAHADTAFDYSSARDELMQDNGLKFLEKIK